MVAILMAMVLAPGSGAAFAHGSVALLSNHGRIGIEFHMEPGWHIYWRNPGDSGEPPKVAWQLPPGWSVGELAWPAPKVLGAPPIVDYGYENQVLITARLQTTPAERGTVGAQLTILVCKDVCVPAKVTLQRTVSANDADAPQEYRAADAALPKPLPASWRVSAVQTHDGFEITGRVGHPIHSALFFASEESQVDNDAPRVVMATADGFRLRIKKADELLHPLTRLPGVLEVDGTTVEMNVPVSQEAK